MKRPTPIPIEGSDLLRWRVFSFSNRREDDQLIEYLVELRTEHGLNSCQCPHFQNRLKKYYNIAISSGIPYEKIDLIYCKHLKLAQDEFTKSMIEATFQRSKSLDRGI